MAKKNAKDQVANGKHPWQGGEHQKRVAKKLLEDGTHHLLSGKIQHEANMVRIKNGTHNFLGGGTNKRLLEQGKHISQNKEFQEKFAIAQREKMLNRLESEHWTCEICGKQGKGKTNYPRHVGSKACENARKKNIFT